MNEIIHELKQKEKEKIEHRHDELVQEMEEKKEEMKQHRSAASRFFHSLFNISDDQMTYDEIDRMMYENTIIHGPNMWILMMATFIASIGLNVNSTAVIIGAMLVSPLMSGIMTMGYSLAVRDVSLLLRALGRFGVQVTISLVTSTIYFLISPLSEATTEMIARTSPTIWDVLIATFGGIAGAIGNTRNKKSNVIPGVAIATALMPPLCTAGYGIATGQSQFFLGAGYLFLINTMFISLATMIMTLIMGVPYHRSISKRGQKTINRVIFAVSMIVIIPSIMIGARTVYDSVISASITRYLSEQFTFDNTTVVKTETDIRDKQITVSLVGNTIAPDVVSRLEESLSDYGLEDFKLKVTQNSAIIPNDGENGDKITMAIQEKTINDLQTELDSKDEELDEKDKQLESLQEQLDGYSSQVSASAKMSELGSRLSQVFTYLSDISCGTMTSSEGDYVLLTAVSSKKLSNEELATIENYLKTETGSEKVTVQITQPKK